MPVQNVVFFNFFRDEHISVIVLGVLAVSPSFHVVYHKAKVRPKNDQNFKLEFVN